MDVQLDDLARMNLLGLFLQDLLRRNLARPEGAARARRLRGHLVLRAGRMAVTLHLEGHRLRLERGAVAQPTAEVTGDLATFLAIGLGHPPLGFLLRRQLRVRGNLGLLLRTLPLLRVRSKDQGILPARKFGRLWRFPRRKVDAWLKEENPPQER